MKKTLLFIVLAAFVCSAINAQSSAKEWSKSKAKKWFRKKEWLQGVHANPHKSIDIKEFARQYHANESYWKKAFEFIKEHDPKTLAVGKYTIDETNVTASVTEDPSKDFDKTQWESHKKYIDIQYIVSGEEKMGVWPVSKATVTEEYNEKRDAAHYSAPGKFYVAGPGTFFIFFAGDAHRPNITPGGNKTVKKLVIKVRAAE